MKILMTGATGTIGNAIGAMLIENQHEVLVVSRYKEKAQLYLEFPAEIFEVDLTRNKLTSEQWQGVDAVIHLMGETISGRWTEKKKNAVLESRKLSSENLLANMPQSIKVVLSASAQNIYDSSYDIEYTESDLVNDKEVSENSFLKNVCLDWEKPFIEKSLEFTHTRFAQMRIGLVHDTQSGILKQLIPVFQRGMGGHLGSGRQWMSWISLEDVARAFVFTLVDSHLSGPVNLAAPMPEQNKNWTYSVAAALGVIKSLSVPEVALKLLLGEMSSLALSSVKMKPQKLLQAGFKFKHESLTSYLSEELKDFKGHHSVYYVKQFVPASIDKVFPFFAEAKNLEKITPPLLNFKIDQVSDAEIKEGTLIDYSLKVHGLPMKWKTIISTWNPPYQFVDEQLKGPYTRWHHTHSFKEFGHGNKKGTLMSDRVQFKLPMGFLGFFVAQAFVQKDVESIFKFRREILKSVKFEE